MLAWKSLYHLSPTMMSGTYAAKRLSMHKEDAKRYCFVIVVNNHNHNPAKLLTGIVQNQSTKNKLAKFT